MFIKSMVIDGFKSYGQRTVIEGFDNQFNAITGLNGSGKSNILDSICFLLGITNLSCVRASNMQELVYKNGQAGVTKATVSVTFDNRDKNQSPLGYEHYDEVTVTRQVVIGGKNKYLINGSNVQNNRVADFFRSVQLNVNNPHFLIMQGRITKVLNMKPPEILALIEEAAGTRMYEAKKQQAEKTIEKKDAKLKEINDILEEEINPTLAKLRQERSAYLEYQKIQRELEHLTKLYLAWKFVCAEEGAVKTKEELKQLHEALEQFADNKRKGAEEMEEIDVAIKELERAKENEIGTSLVDKEKLLKESEKKEAMASSGLKALKDNIKQEDRKKKQIEKSLGDDHKALAVKEKTMAGMKDMFDNLREEDEGCRARLETAQANYQAISLGEVLVEGGGSATLQDQIMQAKEKISSAQTEIKAADTKIKHNTEQLKKKQIEMKKTEAEYKRDSGSQGKVEAAVKELESRLGKINYEEGLYERLDGESRELRQQVGGLRNQVERVFGRYPNLNFEYRDPERGFDRRKVRGVAARLFKIREPSFCMSLESVAGGKLYNVVIDTDMVGKALLKGGNLQRRTTFIPLNKIQARRMDPRILQEAQKLVGKDNVWSPLDLVEFDQSVEGAMCHLFSNVLICRDLNIAEKVAYNPRVQTNCVTLDGDTVSVSGDLSGGAAKQGGSMLEQLVDIQDQEDQLGSLEKRLEGLQQRQKEVQGAAQQWEQVSQQLDQKKTELDMIKQRLQQTEHHQLGEAVEKLGEEIEAVKTGVEEAKKTVVDENKKVKDIQYKIDHAKEIREKELKAADIELKKCKKDAEASKAKWSAKEQEEGSIKLELEELQTSIKGAEEQLEAVAQAVVQWEEQIKVSQEEVNQANEGVKEAKQEVKLQKDVLSKQIKEIASKASRKEQLIKQAAEQELESQKMAHSVSKLETDVKEADRRVADMLESYEWIKDDRSFFGQPNTAYDFKAQDPAEAGRRIQKLESTKEKLGKSVNMRAMNMLGKAEEQYNELMKKKTIVQNDKAKILETIKELDHKKKEALRQAWEQVNKDFGSIFGSLLPGTTAKLEPLAGQDVLAGLEVKVAFGGVWKESLTELSGGQRSLVALSLILSLLLFKPAPLYILDEVDAALDLSHTQNIGHMLKTHFKSSQFIVVSLKDGMFNNANVLFRTKFVDGMSTVTRTTQMQNKQKK